MSQSDGSYGVVKLDDSDSSTHPVEEELEGLPGGDEPSTWNGAVAASYKTQDGEGPPAVEYEVVQRGPNRVVKAAESLAKIISRDPTVSDDFAEDVKADVVKDALEEDPISMDKAEQYLDSALNRRGYSDRAVAGIVDAFYDEFEDHPEATETVSEKLADDPDSAAKVVSHLSPQRARETVEAMPYEDAVNLWRETDLETYRQVLQQAEGDSEEVEIEEEMSMELEPDQLDSHTAVGTREFQNAGELEYPEEVDEEPVLPSEPPEDNYLEVEGRMRGEL